jgi:hypothetical protein
MCVPLLFLVALRVSVEEAGRFCSGLSLVSVSLRYPVTRAHPLVVSWLQQADAAIQWAAETFANAVFLTYEQIGYVHTHTGVLRWAGHCIR